MLYVNECIEETLEIWKNLKTQGERREVWVHRKFGFGFLCVAFVFRQERNRSGSFMFILYCIAGGVGESQRHTPGCCIRVVNETKNIFVDPYHLPSTLRLPSRGLTQPPSPSIPPHHSSYPLLKSSIYYHLYRPGEGIGRYRGYEAVVVSIVVSRGCILAVVVPDFPYLV